MGGRRAGNAEGRGVISFVFPVTTGVGPGSIVMYESESDRRPLEAALVKLYGRCVEESDVSVRCVHG